MKKSRIMILLLAMVMILAVSAVSAADIDDASDAALEVSDEATIDEVAADDSADDAVNDLAAADEPEPTVAAPGDKNFTTLQQEINAASVSKYVGLKSNYVRAENDSDIVISSDVIIDGGNNYTIDANNLGGIFKINTGVKLTLIGVTLINGNSDKGGAIYNDGAISVITCVFSDNNASYGGAIYNHGTAEIISSEFNDNTANIGGAIFSDNNVSIIGSAFERNFVDDGGSAIAINGTAAGSIYTIVSSSFNENRMKKDDNPAGCGAVYAVGDKGTTTIGLIQECQFTDNSAESNGLANGGAIKLEFASTATIQDSYFEGNTATVSGGAIDLQANTGMNPEATIVNCTFKDNHAAGGAAVAALNNVGEATLTIINSTFENNIATMAGGAVYSDRSSKTTISGSNFTDNNAPLGGAVYALKDLTVNEYTLFVSNDAELGGAIYVAASYDDASLTVQNVAFVDNFVTDGGSAIAVKAAKGKQATYNIADSIFYKNTMYEPTNPAGCGAVYTVGDNGTVQGMFTHNLFINNTASSDGWANGGAIKLEFNSKAIVQNCTFINNTASLSGGAIDLQSNVDMNPVAIVANCTFENNGAQAGGAIACLESPDTGHSTLIVVNSIFNGNEGIYGGAIYCDDFSTVTVSGSNFTDNGADMGGAIYTLNDLSVYSSTFNLNVASTGAAIYVSDKYVSPTLTVTDSTFTHNVVSDAGAVAIYGTNGNNITYDISDSTFADNLAYNMDPDACCAGAAIYTEGYATGTISNSEFTGNEVDSTVFPNGGAVKIQFGGDATIENCTFVNNTAALTGGAIDVQSMDGVDTFVNIFDCTFFNNTAGSAGGAIAVLQTTGNSYVSIINSSFSANEAVGVGGAIYAAVASGASEVYIESSNFTANIAPEGAAIYALDDLSVSTSMFELNVASTGAAIYVSDKYKNVTLTVAYTTISENIVGDCGAVAIYGKNGKGVTYEITDSYFVENDAVNIDPDACCAGAALYIEGVDAKGIVSDCEFTGNAVDSPVFPNGGAVKIQFGGDATIVNCTFKDNAAGLTGGAIDVQSMDGVDTFVTIEDCTFINNTAGSAGGAIAVLQTTGNSYVDIINSTFTANEAVGVGGAIYAAVANGASVVTVEGSDFEFNIAPEGAAIYALDDLFVDDSTFCANNASTGAAIYISDKYDAVTLTVTNSIFDENFVDDCGAVAIYGKYGNGLKYLINESIFTENVAYNNATDACCAGAAVYAEGVYAIGTISGSVFSENVVDSTVFPNGGAVKIQFGGEATIVNCTFEDNMAGLTGGAIDVQSMDGVDTFVVIDECVFTDNTAGSAGGAIAVLQTTGFSYVTVNNSVFYENEAVGVGGAIYAAVASGASQVYVEGCLFDSNDATTGGAIYALDDLTVFNSEFDENIAEGGAAIYVSDKYNNVGLLVQNSTFTENIASEAGAGILIDASNDNGIDFNILDSDFTSNIAVNTNESACCNGAAVYIEGNATGAISNSNFTKNFVDSPVYPNGAAIKVQFGANVIVDECTFDSNEATYTGGAIDVQSNDGLDTQLTVTDSVFKNNKALAGAAIASLGNYLACTVSINNCTFESNEAELAGVVYIDSFTTATITDSEFVGNAAEAAIYNVGNLGLRNNTIDSVIITSAKYGGQILSDTYIIVLNNGTQEVAAGDEIELYAVIVDDNNNTIIGKGNLSFTIAGEDDINATFYPGTNSYRANYALATADTIVVSAIYSEMDEFLNLTVKTGTLVGQKANATFTIFAENIIEGENATIYVTLFGLNNTGLNANVKVVVNDTEYPLEIINGTGNLTVSGLAGGSYPIFAIYDGAHDYNSAYTSNTFFVKSLSILEVIAIPEIVYGNNQIIAFFLHDSDDDPITYAVIYVGVNGTEKQVVTDEKGLANIELGGFDVGTYTIEAFYLGDEIYNATENNDVKFNVTKAESAVAILNVTEEPVFGDDLEIYYIELNGTAVIVVKDANNATVAAVVENNTIFLTDLAVGTYTVTATIPETVNFKGSSDEISFTVGKDAALVVIDPVIDEIIYPGEVNITYLELNGVAVIVVKDENNATVAAAVENGTIYLTGLNAGTYTVTATIAGNENITGDVSEITFTVDKDDAEVIIYPVLEDIIYPGEVNITYDEYGGIASISVLDDNGTDVPFTVANNVISLTGLAAGKYYVFANIPDSDNYYGDVDTLIFNVEKAIPTFTSKASENNTVGGTVIISAYAPEDATGIVWLMVDGELYGTDELLAGIAVFAVDGLEAGHHSYEVTYEGDANYAGPNSDVNSFDVVKSNATDNVTIDVNIPANSTDTVFTVNLPKDATGYLLVDIDGKNYYATVENGTASVTVPALVPGNYTANVAYSGDSKYDPVSKTTNVTVPSNVPESALTIPETSETTSPTYSVKLPSDATGFLIVDVDGTQYVAALNNGSASVTVPNLSEGKHNVTVTYSGDSKYSTVIKDTTLNVHVPVYEITGKDVSVVYSAKGTYKVLVTKDGAAVGAGVSVAIKFNGKTKTVKTDANGYATFKFTAKLKVKKYTITATYKNGKATNKVTVKHVLKAKNYKIKKSKKVNKIKVKTNKVNGKYLKGKKLTLKIKGKKLKAKTNKKGVATFKLKKSITKKLKKGKKYKYTVTYGKDKVTKKVTVKK